jgi:hypothetical protein
MLTEMDFQHRRTTTGRQIHWLLDPVIKGNLYNNWNNLYSNIARLERIWLFLKYKQKGRDISSSNFIRSDIMKFWNTLYTAEIKP